MSIGSVNDAFSRKIPERRTEFGKKLSSRSGTLKGIIL